MDPHFPATVESLQALARQVTRSSIEPLAAQVDAQCLWPAHSMAALAEAGLLGLHVPTSLGGHGQGLQALAAITETIGRACPSSALCFGMHCVGTAVIAAKATDYQQQHYLRAIAQGRHITTLALSESGSGAHFYLPATALTADGGRSPGPALACAATRRAASGCRARGCRGATCWANRATRSGTCSKWSRRSS